MSWGSLLVVRFPSRTISRSSRVAPAFTRSSSPFDGYDRLWRWSVEELEDFWESMWHFFAVPGVRPVLGRAGQPGDAGGALVRRGAADLHLRGLRCSGPCTVSGREAVDRERAGRHDGPSPAPTAVTAGAQPLSRCDATPLSRCELRRAPRHEERRRSAGRARVIESGTRQRGRLSEPLPRPPGRWLLYVSMQEMPVGALPRVMSTVLATRGGPGAVGAVAAAAAPAGAWPPNPLVSHPGSSE